MQTRRIRAPRASSLASLGARLGSFSSLATLVALTACSGAEPAANHPRDRSESVDSDASAKRVVGYLPYYRGPLSEWSRTLDFSRLTHVTLAFASVDTEGCGVAIHYREKEATSRDDDPGLPAFVAKAHSSGTKVCLAVGGGGQLSSDFGKAILNGPTELAEKVASYAQAHDLDCIDVDQEESYPTTELDTAYGTFVRALSSRLHGMQKQLTAAVAQWNPNKVLPVIGEFDFLSVMAYDLNQPDKSSIPVQGSSIAESQAQMDWWVNQGADKAKLLWGVPFYGYKWDGDGVLGEAIPYRGIIEKLGSAPAQDELKIESSTFTLNSSATIRSKAELARDNYGGIMVWELWQDATDERSLLRVISEVMQ